MTLQGGMELALRGTRLKRSSRSSTRKSTLAWPDSTIKLRIAGFGDKVFASSPAEFGKHIVEFIDKWSQSDPGGTYQPACHPKGWFDRCRP